MFTLRGKLSFLALLMLLAGGCSQLSDFGDSTMRFFRFAHGQTPRSAALMMQDSTSPDARRQGINQLVDQSFGREPPYTTRYRQIAEADPDYLVRATAIRALNRARRAEATPLYITALSDSNELVRLEGAKALIHMPDPNAVAPLVKLVNDAAENRDVRIAAAAALEHYRTLEVGRALVEQLTGREFGLAWQAHRSLVTLTGQDMRYDEEAWLNLLTGPAHPLG